MFSWQCLLKDAQIQNTVIMYLFKSLSPCFYLPTANLIMKSVTFRYIFILRETIIELFN